MGSIPGQIIEGVLWCFLMFLWARLVIDWVQVFARRWHPTGWAVVILEAVYSVTDPPIKALRRVIPPLRIGTVAIDLAFFIVLIAVFILRSVNRNLLLF